MIQVRKLDLHEERKSTREGKSEGEIKVLFPFLPHAGAEGAVFSVTSFISCLPLVTGGKNIHYGGQESHPPHSAFATLMETKDFGKSLLS